MGISERKKKILAAVVDEYIHTAEPVGSKTIAQTANLGCSSATIRNDARWSQAWPQLTLTLSDIDGRSLGVRAFEPAEYLAAPPRDVTVASGESAAIRMDIVEPSPHAVAFNFRFD